MAPDRGLAGDGQPTEKERGDRLSPLPFVLVLLLSLFIFADKLIFYGLIGFPGEIPPCPRTGEDASDIGGGAWPEKPLAVAGLATTAVGWRSGLVVAASPPSAGPQRRTTEGGHSSSGAGEDERAGRNQSDALLFLLNALILGALVTHVTTDPRFYWMQQTVVLFVLGVVYSLIQEGLGIRDRIGVFGRSYAMWMEIDPHLLLFVLLPPLLAGDAMTIDTSIARRVAKQWLYLAGPGVILNGFSTAFFLWVYLPYQWPFLLCLATGAILCATDPVAVLCLLKELGAPPALTVQIQGESLLNDGTAIVLYTLAYNMLKGEMYDSSDVIVFLMKTVIGAAGFGIGMGYLFYLWIVAASNKLERRSSVIQISLSLCCAYWTFMISEGVFQMSGVLATVAAALVLADKMWPVLVCRESMHIVWHMFDYLGNCLVFFLAGALTGKLMVHIPLKDYFHLVMIYIVLTFIRGVMLLCSLPILNYFGGQSHPPQLVNLADALVMTWGGLRGAVGLALAIQVTIDKAAGKISTLDGNRVLFFVSGIAALTLVVNATTCPHLVNFLGVSQMPETKKRLLMMIHEQLLQHLGRVQRSKGSVLEPEAEDTSPATTKSLVNAKQDIRDRLQEVERWIAGQKTQPIQSMRHFEGSSSASPRRTSNSKCWGCTRRWHRRRASSKDNKSSGGSSSPKSGLSYRSGTSTSDGLSTRSCGSQSLSQASATATKSIAVSACALGKQLTRSLTRSLMKREAEHHGDVVRRLEVAKNQYGQIEKVQFRLLGDMPPMPLLDEQAYLAQLAGQPRDAHMVRAMHEVFLALVNSQYWRLIEAGDVVTGTTEATFLLMSIKLALSHTGSKLRDFAYLQQICINPRQAFCDNASRVATLADASAQASTALAKSLLVRCTESFAFNMTVACAILANAIIIVVEEEHRKENESSDPWLISDLVFCAFFTIEFLMKFAARKCRYFKDSWNLFDFALVVLGCVTIVINFAAVDQLEQGDVSGESRLVRISKAFRVMRLMRVVRLFKFFRVLRAMAMRAEFCQEVRENVQKLTILTCFFKAHVASQIEMKRYFNSGGEVSMSEVAYTLLQSQVACYQALIMAVDTLHVMDPRVLNEVNLVRQSQAIAEILNTFVLAFLDRGVISRREAQDVLNPVQSHLRLCSSRIRDTHFGYVRGTKRKPFCDGEDTAEGDGWCADVASQDDALPEETEHELAATTDGECEGRRGEFSPSSPCWMVGTQAIDGCAVDFCTGDRDHTYTVMNESTYTSEVSSKVLGHHGAELIPEWESTRSRLGAANVADVAGGLGSPGDPSVCPLEAPALPASVWVDPEPASSSQHPEPQ